MRVKLCAAVVGAGAAIVLGAIGAGTGADSGGGSPAIMSAGEMTMGATATVAYSATEETSMAVPADKAPPYGGSG